MENVNYETNARYSHTQNLKFYNAPPLLLFFFKVSVNKLFRMFSALRSLARSNLR